MSEPKPFYFVEVRGSSNQLLFKFDPVRLLVEIKKGDRLETVDLTRYQRGETAVSPLPQNGRIEKLSRL